MKALIELAALCLLPYLFRLCRSRNHIRIRVKLRRTPGLPVLIGIAVLIVAIAAAKT
ncbi:MAG TPA: hypothetical protein VGD53_23335 [Actinoallomurus sp.]|jgi:hypothetical protein